MGRRKRKKKVERKGLLSRLFDPDKPLFSVDITQQEGREMMGIVAAILAIFFLLSLFGAAGSLGAGVARALRLSLGLFAYLLPLLLAYITYDFMQPKEEEGMRVSRVLGVILFFLAVPTVLHLIWPGESAELAQLGLGGGSLGHALSSSLTGAVGTVVAFLISVASVGVGAMLLFDISLAALFGLKVAVEGQEEQVKINQPGKAPVLEGFKKFGLGKRISAPPAPVQVMPQPVKAAPALTSSPTNGYQLPAVDLLETSDVVAESGDIPKNVEKIQKTLKDFSVNVSMGEVNVGPTVTQYTCKPAEGVKLNQITARANDLALSLAAKSIRIEAPIPGKPLVGIEVPNKVRAKVTLREIIESGDFKTGKKSKLKVALGRDVAGAPMVSDIESMPHLLVAGSTGSGKSVCINTIILSLLYQNTPDDLRLVLVDPKRVELTGYNHIPHLLTPVITEPDKTVSALKWAVSEMDRRYRLLSETGKRNIQSFNETIPEGQRKMPYIVLIIDELADLMAVAARDVEGAIVRLAQMARATGIHLIVATQRPSVDVITGLIKANITTRIAFATASQADSRTILDMSGSEKLLGLGDMLFMTSDFGKPRRVQGSFASDKDIENVIMHVKGQGMAQYDDTITAASASGGAAGIGGEGGSEDDLYNEAVTTVVEAGKASASLLQRRLRIGYARAARLLDILYENGVIGPADGARPREVYGPQASPVAPSSAPVMGGYSPESNTFTAAASAAQPVDEEGLDEGGIEAYPESE